MDKTTLTLSLLIERLDRKVYLHARAFKLDSHPRERIRFFTLALAGEAGELANVVKKEWRGDDIPLDDRLDAEITDVLSYCLMISHLRGRSIAQALGAVLEKMREVEQRPEWEAEQGQDRRVEELVERFGECHRTLITNAIAFLNQHDETPFDAASYIAGLINHKLNAGGR